MNRQVLSKSLLFLVFTLLQVNSHAQSGDTFRAWGEETFSAISRDYGISGNSLYRETMGSQAVAFNWPQGVQLHALIAARKINEAVALADEMHQKYWCYHNGRWGYNATANSCGDRYYDDNAWIAKALMELYTHTNDYRFVTRSKEVLAFSMSGENFAGDTPNGGIRWQEGTDGHCLCATAPTMVANLQIYQVTGEAQYLDAGRRLYEWVRNNRFGLGGGYRGYENAVITQAALRLYQITDEQHFYDDAKHMGLAMETVYVDYATHALHETGQWGGHDMSAAYVELYHQDGDINWLNIASGFLSFLHNNLKDSAGRYPEIWGTAGASASNGLLYQASAARGFAELGNTPGGRAKHPDPVAVFKDCNYNAFYSAGLPVGNYTAADLEYLGMPNNQISSVRVQPGYQVTFYTDDNFTGTSLVKTADDACLNYGGFFDSISSVKVEAVVPGATVYRNCNYSSRPAHLPEGSYDMFAMAARGIANDDISSLQVSPGYEIVGYEHYNLTGASHVLSGSQSCLTGSGVDNWISSIRVRSKTVVTEDITDLGGAMTSQYTDSPAGEGITNLIDNNVDTKYLTVHASAWVQYEAPSRAVVTRYTITSANDFAARDPLSWTLQGSNDGSVWAAIDSRANEDFPQRLQTREFSFANANSYRYYRFNLNNNSGAILQLAEVELFGSVDSTGGDFSLHVEAEDYSSMLGVATEACSEGTLNVGWIEANDWMAYSNITIPTTGVYRVEYRVASPNGAALSLDLNGGATQLGQVVIPATGGWQNWQTVSHDVQIPAGTHSVGIFAPQAGWNINWFRITQI